MKSNKYYLIIIFVVALIAAGITYFIFSSREGSHPVVNNEPSIPSTGNNEQVSVPSNAVSKSVVDISGIAFSPLEIRIKKGESVSWKNFDNISHTATSDSGIFDSGLLEKGESFSFTFDEVGEYPYYCIPHPLMRGKIIVE